MAGFEQEFIDRVLAATELTELIGTVVPLTRKSGDNHFGCCPFHNEKTPSFSVNRRKQFFHCFGCGESGNAIGWLIKYEKIAFPEAVRRLAERAHIPVPAYRPTESDSVSEGLYRLHELAQLLFSKRLLDASDPLAKRAHGYLTGRGLSEETIVSAGIGLAPSGWDTFVTLAQQEGYTPQQLQSSGLAGRNEQGKWYDRFRERITFPIQNLSGRIVGFGARVMPGSDDAAKYLNSPETPIYHKSDILYGLPWARDAIRKEDYAIFVEGYLDLITLHQAGIQNAVATSGTALTQKQARLLARFTNNVALVYDGDNAGRRAALRGGDVLIAEGLEVRVAFLPDGEDPDTFVQKNGADAFYKLLKSGSGWLDHQLAHYRAEGMLATPSGSTAALRELVKVISNIRDENQKKDLTKQEFWIKLLSQKLEITESIVRHEISRVVDPRRSDDFSQQPERRAAIVIGDSPHEKYEAQILAFMLRNRNEHEHIKFHRDIHRHLRPHHFQSKALHDLFELFVESWIENGEFPDQAMLENIASHYEGLAEWMTEQNTQTTVPPVDTDPFQYDLQNVDNAIRLLLRETIDDELTALRDSIPSIQDQTQLQSVIQRQSTLIAQKRKLNLPLYLGRGA